MTTTIEQMAKAHYSARAVLMRKRGIALAPWSETSRAIRNREINAMRAAVEVMREPGNAADLAGAQAASYRSLGTQASRPIWAAMIDAILTEGDKG